ncbi:MAG TPA: hypothetical protein VFS71_01125 [Flavobacterium sp.]|uniref:hypothetical protein n=1 Tax=Flavobacterium sp. TaxID=239 RepID=UPI002DBC1D41|nr:hypothetical protein [Flavobacterium sp.]HEU4788269.1 hypothetical protein [Flavobacterium sp.]
MNKFITLLIVLFGFLLMPNVALACDNNLTKNSSKKEISTKMCDDDCCKNDSHSKSKNHNGCGGKCNHAKCACASSSNTSISITEWNIDTNRFNFSSEKQRFYNFETSISSGFNSLWLIPKIS